MLGSIRTAVAVVTVAAISCLRTISSISAMVFVTTTDLRSDALRCCRGSQAQESVPLVHLHLDAARPTASPSVPEVAGGSLLGRQAELHSYRCPRPAQVVCKAPGSASAVDENVLPEFVSARIEDLCVGSSMLL